MMQKRILIVVLTACLSIFVSCKKDEPQSSPSEPTQPQKVDKAKKGTQTGALKTSAKTGEKKPNDRKLVKSKAETKAKAKEKVKAKEKDSAPSKDNSAAAKGKDNKAATPKARLAKPTAVPALKKENKSARDKQLVAKAPTPKALPIPQEKKTAKPTLAAPARDNKPSMRRQVPGVVRSKLANARRPGQVGGPTIAPRPKSTVPSNDGELGSSKRKRAKSSGLPQRIRPNAELLLRKSDVVEVLKYKRKLDVHQLSGFDALNDEYDGIYWGSVKGHSLVAGLQIWRHRSPIESQRRYSQMLRSYPNAEETDAVTKKSFIAYWNDFIYLAFYDMSKQAIVNLTCHRTICNTPQKLVQLASRIKERL